MKGQTHHEQPALALLGDEALHVSLIHYLQCSPEDLVVQEMQAARQACILSWWRAGGSGEVSWGLPASKGRRVSVECWVKPGKQAASCLIEAWRAKRDPPGELLVRHCE